MTPTLLLSGQKSPIFASGICTAILSHQSLRIAPLIRPQAPADSLATQHQSIVFPSRRLLPVPTMLTRTLYLLPRDFSSRPLQMVLSVFGPLRHGLAWLFIKDMMAQYGMCAGAHLVIILPHVAVTRQSVSGLKITSLTFA